MWRHASFVRGSTRATLTNHTQQSCAYLQHNLHRATGSFVRQRPTVASATRRRCSPAAASNRDGAISRNIARSSSSVLSLHCRALGKATIFVMHAQADATRKDGSMNQRQARRAQLAPLTPRVALGRGAVGTRKVVMGGSRQFSSRNPGPSLGEKVFAGAVVVVLAAWGLMFGCEL